MQWESATTVGFPVCTRHKDCRLRKTLVSESSLDIMEDEQTLELHSSLRSRIIGGFNSNGNWENRSKKYNINKHRKAHCINHTSSKCHADTTCRDNQRQF